MAKTDSQPKVAKSKTASSARNGGRSISDDLQPDALLAILKDHLLRLEQSGVKVRFFTAMYEDMVSVGVVLGGVQVIDEEMVFMPEKVMDALPE